ncbi:uncharacterized protein [Typha angustifolia]|uniref:uncharacterized protein n=1 Tax=Typha angustifolia TaxID=59011 RepID=UPI003C2C2587
MAKPVYPQSEPLLDSAPPLSHYYPIRPPDPLPYYYAAEPQPTTFVLLPVRLRRSFCSLRSILSSSTLLTAVFFATLLGSAVFFLFPSDPELRVARLSLDRIHIATSPPVSLTVSIGLEIRVRNPDFFSLDYRSLVVSVGYHGRRLGSMTSDGGHVRARGVSYVEADLKLDGIEVIGDVFYLIEDLARGSIPFDTITEVDGKLHLFFVDVPVQGRISCSVNVNPLNQTIIHQDCYPE